MSLHPKLCCLCVPGISNWTKSQLDCLWFSCKSRQDSKLSSESWRVSYQFHSLTNDSFASPQNQFFPTKCDTENGSKKTAICLWNISNKKSCFSQALSYGPDHAGLSTDLQDVSFLMSSQSLLFNHGQQITHTKAQVSHNIKKNKIKPVVPHLLHAQKTSCTAPGQWKLESVVESSQLPFCCALLLPSCLCCKLMLTVFYYFLSGLCYVLVFRKTSPLQSFLQIEVPFSSHFLGQCWQTREVVYCFMSWQLSTLFPIIGLKHCVLENKDFHIFDLSHSGLN